MRFSLKSMMIIGAVFCLFYSHNVLAQEITIDGHSYYKDGKSWLPKGIKVEAFNRPIGPHLPDWANKSEEKTRSWWGVDEINAIREKFGADVVSITISQPGLDPQSSIYDAGYVKDVLGAIKLARSSGFVVIPSMDAQAENGLPNIPCMPDESTVRAWATIAPALNHDKGIMLEVFNEPCRANSPEGRSAWAKGMQAVINSLRSSGVDNILLLDGIGFAQSTNGLFPMVHDTLPSKMGMAVHPYVNTLNGVNVDNLDAHLASRFGETAEKYPLIATEWNATPTNGCVGDVTPKIALKIIRYLQAKKIGVIGWAIDSDYGKMVKDHEKYEVTDFDDFKGCSKTPMVSGAGKYLAEFPNN